MAIENALYPDELDPASPLGSEDPFGSNSLKLEIHQLKTVFTTTFPNVSGAVTTSDVEMNYLDIATLGTAQTSKALTISAGDTWNVAGMTCSNLGAVTTVDINGGTVDAAAIGATTPAAGAFTTLSASGAVTCATTLTVTGATALNGTLALASGTTANEISIDGTMAGDSDDAIPTEKAVKTYVDNAAYATEAYADARGFYVISAVIEDISTAQTVYIPMSMAGIVTRVDTVLGGTIATANAAISLTTSSDQGMANLTVAFSGSGAGDVDSDTSINNDAVTAGTYLKLTTDGASTNAVPLYVSILVDIS